MKKNKKDKTENTDLIATDVFVLDEIKPESIETKNEQVETKEKEKKKNILLAKIMLVLLVVATIALCLAKLVDHLDKPKNLFIDTLEKTYDDFKIRMDRLESDDLYKAFFLGTSSHNFQMSIETQKLTGDYRGLEETIKNLKYRGKLDIDQDKKYLGADLTLENSGAEELKLSLVQDTQEKYFTVSKLTDGWYELQNDEINILSFDTKAILETIDTIKKELKDIIKDKTFTSEEVSISINSKATNCQRNWIIIKGSEIEGLIDKIAKNESVYDYIQTILGLNVQELKRELHAEDNSEFTLNAYTTLKTGEPLRLEIFSHAPNSETPYSRLTYTSDVNSWQVEFTSQSYTNSLTIKGQLDKTFQATYRDKEKTYTFTRDIQSGLATCALNIISTTRKENILDTTFSYTIEQKTNSEYELKLTATVDKYKNNIKNSFNLDVTSTIDKNIEISQKNIPSSDNKGQLNETEETSIRKDFINYLKNIILAPENTDTDTENDTENN